MVSGSNRPSPASACDGPVMSNPSMRWFETDKEKNRFYLLPGMGGKASRRKRKQMFKWSIAVGLLASALVAGLLYCLTL